MAFFTKDTHSGEIEIDHRASPGIPAAQAERMGIHPSAVKEGAVTRLRTLGCCHCGGVWIENPWRQRPRNHCVKCDKYLCDSCAAVAHEPGYVHRSFQQLADEVRSGKLVIVGGTASRPILKPGDNHG